ncbi:hypothetical protein BKA61DRAFT_709953 [Leptodontidium sp. MPI-SDFR-AT-0119]|nr:hypothetical protein BKA61DRAFT_709953 [Leptodontidium sp. MPI-SDFR-AT-0119]
MSSETSKKIILVLGATGTQGGSVANNLLKYPEQYTTRCLTRSPDSTKAKALAALGAEIAQADLTKPSTLPAAFKDVWGVFAVTDFYDTAVLEDPMSEEKQGKNIVEAAAKAGKSSVDAVIREAGLSGAFIRTGNFYENMILRKYAAYDKDADVITMARPIITADAEITTLYVEKDLAAVCKAIYDQWDDKKSSLDGKYYLASGARETQRQINEVLERVSGKKVVFTTKPTTGIKDRDIMLQLYNAVGMYPGVTVPSPEVLDLGIKLHTCEDYIRERLLPHLGLKAIA